MVGPGDCADDSGAFGVVLGRDAAGGAVASGGAPGGGADGVVREGESNVLGLHPSGSSADLAEPNYRLVASAGRCAPIATDTPGGHCPRPLVSSMRAKAEAETGWCNKTAGMSTATPQLIRVERVDDLPVLWASLHRLGV